MVWERVIPASRKEEGVYFLRTSKKTSTIFRIMNTQKATTVNMQNKNDNRIYIRKCSTPKPKHVKFKMPSGTNINPGFENPGYPKIKYEK